MDSFLIRTLLQGTSFHTLHVYEIVRLYAPPSLSKRLMSTLYALHNYADVTYNAIVT